MEDFVEENRLLRISEVARLTGLSDSTIYAMVERQEFPAPVRAGRRASRWPLPVVRDWMDSRPPATEANWQ